MEYVKMFEKGKIGNVEIPTSGCLNTEKIVEDISSSIRNKSLNF